ncbi:hypothetical protein KKF69_00310, partial [Patescibacteria group bacterium]|nr:hypothetical protein [Patescibacteria group bacterium]
ESQKGNMTAELILMAASVFTQDLGEINATMAQIKTVLQQIATPDFSPEDDRDFYTRLHDYLLKEGKENNNELAAKILTTTEETAASDIENIKSQLLKEQKENKVASEVISATNRHVELKQMRNMFSQIANPATIASPINKERFNKLNEQVLKASKAGDKLASSILDIKLTTKTKDIENLKKDLFDAKQRNDKLAKAILSTMSSSIVPSDNTVQEVTEKDYEEIRKMWEENYRTLPVPFGFSDDKKGRIEWIGKEIEEISTTINLLIDSDLEKKNEGLRRVGAILPFLLLGGFSYQEIITYLNIKFEAAKTVITELRSGEENEEKVEVQSKTQNDAKTLAVEEDN